MADIKITDLTTATVVTETTDYIPVVDVSDTTQDTTGTTKKATVRKILGDKALPGGDFVGTSDTQTLTGKTLTTPRINTPKFNEDVAMTSSSTELNLLDGISAKSGTDATILTGTKGSAYDDITWNGDGDIISMYAGVGDGVADDTVPLNAFLSANAGKSVKIPPGTYAVTGTIGIPANTTVYAYGVKVSDGNTHRTLITIASGSKLFGMEIQGAGNLSYDTNGHAVHLMGDTGSEIENVVIKDCYIHGVGEYGIMCESSNNIDISNCRIEDIGYCGVMVLSGVNVNIDNCHIKSITPGTSLNCYGVAFTNWANYPRSQYCSVTNCLVEDVTIWEGIDTHGGQAIRIQNNVLKGCSRGIVLKMAPSSGTAVYAATDCVVDGNVVYGGGNLGCYVNGTSDVFAVNNIITNNILYDCGVEGGDYLATGGIYLGYTKNNVVSGNVITGAYGSGIVLRRNNSGVTVVGNMITDSQNTTGNSAVGITVYLSSTGIITGNQIQIVNAALNDVVGGTGIYVGSDAGNSMVVGPNQNSYTIQRNLNYATTDHGIKIKSMSMTDDSAISFTPTSDNGFMFIGSATNSGYYGFITYRAAATCWCTLGVGNAAIIATTGALTGTTGTDGKLTVATETDGKIYIENRLGGTKTIYWILFGI